jgi:hypothetical protein
MLFQSGDATILLVALMVRNGGLSFALPFLIVRHRHVRFASSRPPGTAGRFDTLEDEVMSNHLQEPRRVSPWKSQTEQHYEAFVSRLSVKGRAAAEKHDELCAGEAAQGYGELWKRLAGGLSRLAPHDTEMSGQQSVKFHIPDGKYRQQVFALEDTRQGTIVVYLADVVDKAIQRKIIAPTAVPRTYKVVASPEVLIHMELITAETRDMTVCKAMVGWGKKALRTNLSALAKEKEIHAVECLCELAAESWPAEASSPPA